ncbi:dynamin family protein [Bacillus rubiinfantis]|uniref:dynamin family protein n=1 Tax=Bacillus rubiinfantis TaxID=1499680 RepID=UPI0005A899D5|nr:dynamin family protein [Bacillus rubiinfantis]
MVKTANNNETIVSLKGNITLLYEFFVGQKDAVNAEKIKQLAQKIAKREYAVAFCGHFSAGKSTMINRIIGENLLPSSPIPTSANLVKVRSGEDYAKVYFKNEKPRLYLAPYDYELVKSYCKDGDQIQEIEISHSESHLPVNTVVMDTPGIDSADDAHRIATESAIHLADLIFYVMDYNHVQAELNFLFTKELTEAGKDVYLVINQIDKHREEELGFQDFQRSVADAFHSWGVTPARIFYTSLKYPDHPYNQFHELQQFIATHLAEKDQFLVPSVFQSLKKIASEYLREIKKAEDKRLTPFLEQLSGFSDQEKDEILRTYQKITTQLEKIDESITQRSNQFDEEIKQILRNAYLMPFQTRELAESYLESCQPGFKVGFLFSKQKTIEEKKLRQDRFYQDLIDKTKSQLQWHIRECLLRSLKQTSLDDGELFTIAQSFSVTIPEQIIVDVQKSGAILSGDYLLHYTEDVANEIKKKARYELSAFREKFLMALAEQATRLKTEYEQTLSSMGQYVNALSEIKAAQQRLTEREKHIHDLLHQREDCQADYPDLFILPEEDVDIVQIDGGEQSNLPVKVKSDKQGTDAGISLKENIAVTSKAVDHQKITVSQLKLASQLLSDLPGLQKLSAELTEKASRLENKGFTVALFGAFSAGKSSFANALMGENVLPVSPNPTTAAINKIKPVTLKYKHGTARIKFKETITMLEDVNRSLKVFDLHAGDFAEAVTMINTKVLMKSHAAGVLEKTHYSFLHAFSKGYDSLGLRLGTVLETDIREFHEFVALEEKSCYVEWIELYYDCELTRKGITLVDTPGADSINARHTGVAFDYIKNADAVFFVTYYNHAFSKADREFLIQLGRVKDSFQLDKMFFIINAIDLAESEEEKQAVIDYVCEQLIKYGIRNPHLYPLSSLLALEEKTHQDIPRRSGIYQFEQAFAQFIANDLTELAVSAAKNEVERVRAMINNLISSVKEDETHKRKKRQEIEQQMFEIRKLLSVQTPDNIKNRLLQEAEELIYYIKQRVFFRFSDFFKEAFNPSLLKDDGRNLKKALQTAFDEFLESFGFDFAQELRATTVRLDRFVEALFADNQQLIERHVHVINREVSFSKFEVQTNNQLDFPIAFIEEDRHVFTKAMSYFKSPKGFFEKDEKRWMAEELQRVLEPLADHFLHQQNKVIQEHYLEQIKKELSRFIAETEEQVNEYYVSLLTALDGGVPLERLLEIQQKLA